MREEAVWWMRTARRDLERARAALAMGDRAAAVFWAQQAAEKALKALLVALRGWFPRTHNIRALFEALGSDLGLSREELEAAYALTKYYQLARYPDIVEGLPDDVIGRREAEEAVRAAEAVVRAAEEALEELGGGGEEGGREARRGAP